MSCQIWKGTFKTYLSFSLLEIVSIYELKIWSGGSHPVGRGPLGIRGIYSEGVCKYTVWND
jgi:hypothetical protein